MSHCADQRSLRLASRASAGLQGIKELAVVHHIKLALVVDLSVLGALLAGLRLAVHGGPHRLDILVARALDRPRRPQLAPALQIPLVRVGHSPRGQILEVHS